MNTTLIRAVFLAWPPVVVILFRVIGPRRAVLAAILGGLLFLPRGQVELGPAPFALPIAKWTVTSLGLILGVLIFDRRSLIRARPRWLDLPMAAFVLAPLIGLATGVTGSGADIVDAISYRGLGLAVPYAMGRIYFAGGDGPKMVAIALTIAGLSYIPVCLYEEAVGPSRYLSILIYQTPLDEVTTGRLGGWRPVGFLNQQGAQLVLGGVRHGQHGVRGRA